MSDYATNLRRLMARFGLTMEMVVERTGLDDRTIKGILAGANKPHARTLHRLATGLQVSPDELFQDPALLAYHLFDRDTNPVVDEVVAEHPQLFEGWSQAAFDELYSRFGTGGGLTVEGTLAAVQAMNHKRDIQNKVNVLLETSEAALLTGFVNLLYQRVVVSGELVSSRSDN